MSVQSRTPEQIEKAGKLIEKLCTLFYPFVEAACAPRIRAEMTGPSPFTPEQAAEIRKSIEEEMPADLPPEMKEGLRQLAENIDKPFTPEAIEESVKQESANECAQLVRNWLNAFFTVDTDVDDAPSRTIDPRAIDDSMLPLLSVEDAELFGQCCAQGILSEDETLDILRQVKATLPPGKVLPDEAVEFLAGEHITILP